MRERIEDYDYSLPETAIALHPVHPRSACRLLVVGREANVDARFQDLVHWLRRGDLLVVNDTRVWKARLKARHRGGRWHEVLVVELRDSSRALAMIRGGKHLRTNEVLKLENGVEVRVEERCGEHWMLNAAGHDWLELMRQYGHVPIPPYLRREESPTDAEDYQTIFARHEGSAAAPTAGLHFDEPMLNILASHGFAPATLTLHVGAGTFTPIRTSQVDEHRMHAESYDISAELLTRIRSAKAAGGRIIAVGTTVVRALESYMRTPAAEHWQPYKGSTDLYIRPGFEFKIIDALVTNFHAPRSTLLLLVSALAGRERILHAYREALSLGYRFLSFGDAMFIDGRHEI